MSVVNNDAEFIRQCLKWAESKHEYRFKKELTREEKRLLAAVSFGLWEDPDKIIGFHDTYERALNWAIYYHAYADIFTTYRRCDNIFGKQSIQVIFHKLGHVAYTYDYEPFIKDQLISVICPGMIVGLFFASILGVEYGWLSPIASLGIILTFAYWWISKRIEIRWRTLIALTMELWREDMRKFKCSPAFLSWICYQYLYDSLGKKQKEVLQTHICSHPCWSQPPLAE